MKDKILFQERQKFTQWWIWLVLIGIVLIALFGIYKQLMQGEIFGSKPMSNAGLVVFAVLSLTLLFLFWFMELRTKIVQVGIQMQFVPFVKKNVTWEEVASAAVVNYGFVGGWGIRLGTKYGTVFNTKGKMGLAIELKNGKRFLIGTQEPEKLAKVIDEFAPGL